MESSSPPLVIAGVGGSGTRVFPRIVRHAGYYMGAHLNPADDALDFREFVGAWVGPYLIARRRGEPLAERERMKREFLECVRRYREPMDDPSQPWGWKQPRSVHLLAFLHELYPGLRFMHVLRDGRDIAFGKPTPIVWVGDYVLGPDRVAEPLPVRMIRYWAQVNQTAADYAESKLGDGYIQVRFENLCNDPPATIGRMLRFCGSKAAPTPEMLDEVEPQPTTGRWRQGEAGLVDSVFREGQAALERFGYAGS